MQNIRKLNVMGILTVLVFFVFGSAMIAGCDNKAKSVNDEQSSTQTKETRGCIRGHIDCAND